MTDPKDSRPMPRHVRQALDDALADHLAWQEEQDACERAQTEFFALVDPCDAVE
jgi:hypothetical protein